MRHRAWIGLLIAAVALVVPGAAGAARSSACERLRGLDLAPARTIKLVARANDDRGTNLVGCALPGGALRMFASSGGQGVTQRSYAVLQVAGAFVLLRGEYLGTTTVAVRNIRNGDSYEIAFRCALPGGRDCGRGGRSSIAIKAVINRRGQAVAALRFAGSPAIRISGFSRLGERRDFDSGLPLEIRIASLRITSSKGRWSNAGRTYSARLPE
jgi:hypothetical protein